MPQPVGSVRPGGRTARTRTAVLEATREELLRVGFAGLTIERIALRAGVHKTTIYRRWQTRDGVVSDLVTALAAVHVVVPDTGCFEQDLRIYGRSLAATLSGDNGRMFAELLAARTHDEGLDGQLQTIFREWYRMVRVVAVRAVEREQLPEGTEPDAVIRSVAAPIYYRRMVDRRTPDEPLGEHAAATTVAAARAGLFRTGRRQGARGTTD